MFDTGTASRPPAVAEPMLPRIWRFALWLVHEEAQAEALVYRSCVKARHEGLTMHGGSEQALCEMFAIVCQQWHSHSAPKHRLREATARRSPPPRSTNHPATTPLDQAFEATHALPDRHRVVVLLVLVEGFTCEQAAAILGISVQTLELRLAQARIEVGRFLLRAPEQERSAGISESR
ncbi:ECF-type sigma factor [Trinickia sp. LjRoot230]|uniref:RNA polymerase sigma factor n=1 Tax=Trinickia sp. LjRoot230 TaxID=3342288 RepID=UPI003ECF4C45